MEQLSEIQETTRKIYKDRAIWVGTFLGGPLTAAYLIAENFKAFNDTEKAKKTWIFAILATIIIFGGIFLIPENVNIPNQLIPLIYTAIAYFLVQHYQGQNITAHINAGGELFSWWRTIAVGLIGLAITIIPIIVFVFLTDGGVSTAPDVKTYGIMQHEITFDKNNISANEVDKIADGLTKTAFFDNAAKKFVYVKKQGTDFEISISCNKSIIDNPDVIQPLAELRKDLQSLFPAHKIRFNLVVDNIDNVVKRIE